MRKHAGRIILIVAVVLLIAVTWLAAHWLGNVREESNRVQIDARELSSYLRSPRYGTDRLPEDFGAPEVWKEINTIWQRGIAVHEYSPDVLAAPDEND